MTQNGSTPVLHSISLWVLEGKEMVKVNTAKRQNTLLVY